MFKRSIIGKHGKKAVALHPSAAAYVHPSVAVGQFRIHRADEPANRGLTLEALHDAEQKRMAQDIHDDLGQLLGAMKIELTRLQQQLPRTADALQKQVDGMHELANAMVTSIHRIVAALPPKALSDMGLRGALTTLATDFAARHRIRCTVDTESADPALPAPLASMVYRVVQEALNNVVKHAAADAVHIEIENRHGQLLLSIVDDGIGMDDPDRPCQGFGLAGMRERVSALEGRMRLTSNGDGTRIFIAIPLQQKPGAANRV